LTFCVHGENVFIVPQYGTSLYISERYAEHNLMQEWCTSSFSWPVRFT